MKNGDIVYCKKTFTFQGGNFLNGCEYKLDVKYESYVILYTGDGNWMLKLSMTDFKTHFLTIAEYRKLKLEKLENW